LCRCGFRPGSLLRRRLKSEVLIKHAVVMTVTYGNIQNGEVYIQDGKIAAVGKDVSVPAGATVIDAGGKYLRPGLIDAHSHIRKRGHESGHATDDDDDDDGRLRLPGQSDLSRPGRGCDRFSPVARVGQHDRRPSGG
jgi:formylmethanofuran dehydrogenase subunit A